MYRIKNIISFILIFGLIFSGGGPLFAQSISSAVITDIDGEVFLQRFNSKTAQKASLGDILDLKDKISVGFHSSVKLLLKEGTHILINEQNKATLEDLITGQKSLALRVKVIKDEKQTELQPLLTPEGMEEALKTITLITRIACQEGQVWVRGLDRFGRPLLKEVILNAGETTSVTEGQAPSEPSIIAPPTVAPPAGGSTTAEPVDETTTTTTTTTTAEKTTTSWTQVNTNGFGNYTPGGNANRTTLDLVVFNSALYAGTGDTAAIWRTTNGTTWTQVNTNNFGDSNVQDVHAMSVFNGKLYAFASNPTTGVEIWRSTNGTSWTQVNTDGFGDANNTGREGAFAVFNGFLYASTRNRSTGVEVWRTSNGTTWTQANTDGFGDANNRQAHAMISFGNYLYVGTENPTTGAEVWRTSDGTTWSQVNTDGFGVSSNDEVSSFAVFNGVLYTGVSGSSAKIFKTSDGATWTQVVSDGFGDSNNGTVEKMLVDGDWLYASTYNASTGVEIWRSKDGSSWTQINTNGFGDANNREVHAMAIFNDAIYAGTLNYGGGGRRMVQKFGATLLLLDLLRP